MNVVTSIPHRSIARLLDRPLFDRF